MQTADFTCGVCLEELDTETFNYKCGHRICAVCFMGIACPTRPEADTNSRNNTMATAMKCPFCRSEVSESLQTEITDRMDALVSRPVHEAEFRMSRTTNAKRFFDGEISASEDEVAGWIRDACTTAETAHQLMDILVHRRAILTDHISSTDPESPIPSTGITGAPPDDGAVCDQVLRKVQHIARRIYRSGHITPSFICNLHKAGFAIGGEKALAEAESTMAANNVSEGEVRAVRRALESIAESRRDAIMQYAGTRMYVEMARFPPSSIGLIGTNQLGRRRLARGVGGRPQTP
jgi:hypothetical protein